MAWIYDDTRGQGRYAWGYYDAEAINNAWEMYYYFFDGDLMSLEALAGLVGNVCYESAINPWQEQVPSGPAFGLIGWDPPTDLTDVLGNSPTGSAQCSLIYNEIMNNESVWGGGRRFIPTSRYPYNGTQFCALGDVREATEAYFHERERGTWSELRYTIAEYYYWDVYRGQPPPPPPPPPEDDRMSLYFYILKRYKAKKGLL